MQYRQLGRTDIQVSTVCLGTMTFGEQNTPKDGESQLDYALDCGINYIDTAELYSIPPKVETQGSTERIIGDWLGSRGNRDKIVLATKIAGPSFYPYFRNGERPFSAQDIKRGLDGSLRRLKTDYIDVYYLHWPARKTNYFGQLGYSHQVEDTSTPILETLSALAGEVQAGRIRHIALSNETPWGLMEFLRLSEQENLPRVVTVQNPYSLLNRTYEVGLAEMSIREDVGLSAYSPLGFGTLSGKYLGGRKPEGARLSLWGGQYPRYTNAEAKKATEAYVQLAQEHGYAPAQMALAYAYSRPFVTSVIIGATSMEQLAQNIAATDLRLDSDVLNEIEAIHRSFPNPAP